MSKRYSLKLPKIWLMTDARLGEALLLALESLPKGAGVIFRHYQLDVAERRALFEKVRRVAKRRRLMLLLAGSARLAQAWRADGSHGRHRGAVSAPVHSMRERILAERLGIPFHFVSPVFATRSHPDAKPLGRVRFGMLALRAKGQVIALGGMNPRQCCALAGFNVKGWAGIDGFLPTLLRR